MATKLLIQSLTVGQSQALGTDIKDKDKNHL